jgi:hypothetical protein
MEAWTCTGGGLSFRVPSGAPRLEHCAHPHCAAFFLRKKLYSLLFYSWLADSPTDDAHAFLSYAYEFGSFPFIEDKCEKSKVP